MPTPAMVPTVIAAAGGRNPTLRRIVIIGASGAPQWRTHPPAWSVYR